MEGIQEDVRVAYDWKLLPSALCSSFGHENDSCSAMAATLAALEIPTTDPTTEVTVQDETVAGTPPPPPLVIETPVEKQPLVSNSDESSMRDFKPDGCSPASLIPCTS